MCEFLGAVTERYSEWGEFVLPRSIATVKYGIYFRHWMVSYDARCLQCLCFHLVDPSGADMLQHLGKMFSFGRKHANLHISSLKYAE